MILLLEVFFKGVYSEYTWLKKEYSLKYSNQMKYLVKQVLDDYELYAQEHVLNPGKMTINLT